MGLQHINGPGSGAARRKRAAKVGRRQKARDRPPENRAPRPWGPAVRAPARSSAPGGVHEGLVYGFDLGVVGQRVLALLAAEARVLCDIFYMHGGGG